ncbi:MAG: hypothetical protein ACKO96_36955, partial [Flammeovirgaceae bacterium]
MPNEFEERGPYGRVRSIYPGTSFDGGMPGQGEQMPGVEEMVAKFRGGFKGVTSRAGERKGAGGPLINTCSCSSSTQRTWIRDIML